MYALSNGRAAPRLPRERLAIHEYFGEAPCLHSGAPRIFQARPHDAAIPHLGLSWSKDEAMSADLHSTALRKFDDFVNLPQSLATAHARPLQGVFRFTHSYSRDKVAE